MKNAIVLHGQGETPESFYLPYIKTQLIKKGYDIWIPQLPESEEPRLEVILPFLLKSGTFTKETIIIARSASCPIALSVLENINIKIHQVILVAAHSYPITPGGRDLTVQKVYDWKKIKNNVDEVIVINSNNDPYGCTVEQGMKIVNNLEGKFILRPGEGHFGSERFNQPYKEFPLLVSLVK